MKAKDFRQLDPAIYLHSSMVNSLCGQFQGLMSFLSSDCTHALSFQDQQRERKGTALSSPEFFRRKSLKDILSSPQGKSMDTNSTNFQLLQAGQLLFCRHSYFQVIFKKMAGESGVFCRFGSPNQCHCRWTDFPRFLLFCIIKCLSGLTYIVH